MKIPGALGQQFKKLGTEAKFLSPQEFASFIADENRRLAAIIRASGVKGSEGGRDMHGFERSSNLSCAVISFPPHPEERPPKSGCPDFGDQRVEIGNSRFRWASRRMDARHALTS